MDENADEECDESELTFSPVFHANPLPTCISTLDEGRFVGVNDAWVRLFGYAREEAVGNTALDLNIWVHSAERAEFLRQLKATGSARDFEYAVRAKSGEVRNVLVAAEVIECSRTRYNLSILHDITERKRAEEETRRQNVYLEALHQTTLGVVSELNVDDLLEKLLERAVSLIGAAYGWLYLVTPEQDAIELQVATGMFRRYKGMRLKYGEGLSGRIWEIGEAIAVEDYQSWQGRSGNFEGGPIGPAIGMPLKSGGQVIGVIGLTRAATDAPFSDDEQALATRFGNLAAIALKNARWHTALQTELGERARADQAGTHHDSHERRRHRVGARGGECGSSWEFLSGGKAGCIKQTLRRQPSMSNLITRETLGFGLAGIAILLRMASDWLFATGGPLPYQMAQAILLLLALALIGSRREIVFLKGGNTRRAILEGLLAMPLGLILGLALALIRYHGPQFPAFDQAAVVIANNLFFPAVEELEFRGFFLGWLIQRKMSPTLAVWIVSIVHLLAHIHYFWQGNWVTIVTALLSLLWFGGLTVRTKSLWGAYVAHAAFNIFVFLPVAGAGNIR